MVTGRSSLAAAWPCAAALLAVELSLRIAMGNLAVFSLLDLFATDGRRMALTPSAQVTHTGVILAHPAVEQEVNAQGFRGAERPLRAERPGLRIAMVGDSFIYGMGVPNSGTISTYLQAIMRRRCSPDVEVLNFGVPNTGFEDYLEQIRLHVGRWQPDIILLGIESEDFRKSILPKSMRGIRLIEMWSYQHVYILRLASSLAAALGAGQADPIPPAKLLSHFRRLTRTARGMLRAETMVVVIGDVPKIVDMSGRQGKEEFGRVLAACGVPWIDISDLRARNHLCAGDYHLNPYGNLIAARRIASFLDSLRAFSPAGRTATRRHPAPSIERL